MRHAGSVHQLHPQPAMERKDGSNRVTRLILGVLVGSVAYLVLNEVYEVQNPLEWAVPIGALFVWMNPTREEK